MGGQQSNQQTTSLFNMNEWSEQYYSSGARILSNKRNPNTQIQQYTLLITNNRQMQLAQQILALRKQDPSLVSVLHYQIFNQVNSTQIKNYGAYTGLLYTERVPVRLGGGRTVGFPDILHVLSQTINGFQKLVRYYGYFMITPECIGINSQDVVKVWHNPNFSSVHPFQTAFSQQDMLYSILQTIQKSTDLSTMPRQEQSLKNFIIKQSSFLNFQVIKGKLSQYSRYFNNGIIPNKIRHLSRPNIIQNSSVQYNNNLWQRNHDNFRNDTINIQAIAIKYSVPTNQSYFNSQPAINNQTVYANQTHNQNFNNNLIYQNRSEPINPQQSYNYNSMPIPNPYHINNQLKQQVKYMNKPFTISQVGNMQTLTSFQNGTPDMKQIYNYNVAPILQPQTKTHPQIQKYMNNNYQFVLHNHQRQKNQDYTLRNRVNSQFNLQIQNIAINKPINLLQPKRQYIFDNKIPYQNTNNFPSKFSESNRSHHNLDSLSKPKSIPLAFQMPIYNRSQSKNKQTVQPLKKYPQIRKRSSSQLKYSPRPPKPSSYVYFNNSHIPATNSLKTSQQIISTKPPVMDRQVNRQLHPAAIKQSIQKLNIPMTNSKIKSEQQHLQNLKVLNNSKGIQTNKSQKYPPPIQPNPLHILQGNSSAHPFTYNKQKKSVSFTTNSFHNLNQHPQAYIPISNNLSYQHPERDNQFKNDILQRIKTSPAQQLPDLYIQSSKAEQQKVQLKQEIVSPRPQIEQQLKQIDNTTLLSQNNKITKHLSPQKDKLPIELGGSSNQSFSTIGYPPGIARQTTTDKFFHDVRQSQSINNSTRNFYSNFINEDFSQVVQLSSPLDIRLKNRQGKKPGQLILQLTQPIQDQSQIQSKSFDQNNQGNVSLDLIQKLKIIENTQSQQINKHSVHTKFISNMEHSPPSRQDIPQKYNTRQKSQLKIRSGSKQFNKDVAKFGFCLPPQDSSSSQKGTLSQRSNKQGATYEQNYRFPDAYMNAIDAQYKNIGQSTNTFTKNTGLTSSQNYDPLYKFAQNQEIPQNQHRKSYTDIYLNDYFGKYSNSKNIQNQQVCNSNKKYPVNQFIGVENSYKIQNPTYSITSSLATSMKPQPIHLQLGSLKQQSYKIDWDPQILADIESKVYKPQSFD